MQIRYTRILHVESHIYIQTQMRCLDACVEVCYCARMGSIWSAHTRISLPFLKVRIRMTDLWIHVVLQCEKGSLRNGEKGECPSMANRACFWREDCPGYVKLSAAIQWEKLNRCQKQGVKAHDVMAFVSYDIHRRLFSFFTCTYFSKEWDFMSLRTAHAIGCTQQHRASRSKPFLRVP